MGTAVSGHRHTVLHPLPHPTHLGAPAAKDLQGAAAARLPQLLASHPIRDVGGAPAANLVQALRGPGRKGLPAGRWVGSGPAGRQDKKCHKLRGRQLCMLVQAKGQLKHTGAGPKAHCYINHTLHQSSNLPGHGVLSDAEGEQRGWGSPKEAVGSRLGEPPVRAGHHGAPDGCVCAGQRADRGDDTLLGWLEC